MRCVLHRGGGGGGGGGGALWGRDMIYGGEAIFMGEG